MLTAARKETGSGVERDSLQTSFRPVTRLLKITQGSLTRLLKDHSRRKLKATCFLPDR